MWEFCLQVIEYYGKDEKYGNRTYRYYYANGFKYWITKIDRPKQLLINKAKA